MNNNQANTIPDQAQNDVELEKLKCNIEIWKKVIDVQQHFNTIEMQIRNFAVTILAGILAAAGLALRDPKNISIFNLSISSASAILLSGIIVLLSFYFMDRFWYHRLLQGAVSRGEGLETEIKRILPEATLSQTIRAESPVFRIRSNNKIDIFYFIIILFLFVSAIGVNNWGSVAPNNIPSYKVIYTGSFNTSTTQNHEALQKAIDTDRIKGYGTLEIKYNNTQSNLETISNIFR
jgi:hypothetical protein